MEQVRTALKVLARQKQITRIVHGRYRAGANRIEKKSEPPGDDQSPSDPKSNGVETPLFRDGGSRFAGAKASHPGPVGSIPTTSTAVSALIGGIR